MATPAAAFDTEAVADDFEWTLEGFEFEGTSVWRGREPYVEWFRAWTGNRGLVASARALDRCRGDRVAALTYQSATGIGTGVPVELNLGTVWELKDGRVVRMRTYRSQAEALKAAGLEE